MKKEKLSREYVTLALASLGGQLLAYTVLIWNAIRFCRIPNIFNSKEVFINSFPLYFAIGALAALLLYLGRLGGKAATQAALRVEDRNGENT